MPRVRGSGRVALMPQATTEAQALPQPAAGAPGPSTPRLTAGRRAGALTVYGSPAATAAALGPPIGGLLIHLSDWRLCFLVNVPIGALVVVLASRRLVESRSPGRRTLPDLTGALVLAASL